MKFVIIIVPYELGRLREGVGRGPEHLLTRGIENALASNGASVRTKIIELDERYMASGSGEEDAGFELIRLVAKNVREARASGEFPVMLSGSCFPAVGVVAGLDEISPGVVWFDAHPDYSEPSTTTSGYLDSMGLSILTGSAWQALRYAATGVPPVSETSVILAGARMFDASEKKRLAASRIKLLAPSDLRSPNQLLDAVRGLSPPISGLYVHIDLDVLDTSIAGVNVFGAPGGIDADQLDMQLRELLKTQPARAVSFTAYDPNYDLEGRVPPIALRLMYTIARSR